MQRESLPIASNRKRVVGFVIDDMIVNLLLLMIFSSQLSALMRDITVVDAAAVEAVNRFIVDNIAVVLAVKVLYHTVLIWQSGMTLGKYVVRIKTVDRESGSTPTFMQAFWRASVRLISEIFFYVGFLFAFFSPLHQTLHDKLSNCVVIDENK